MKKLQTLLLLGVLAVSPLVVGCDDDDDNGSGSSTSGNNDATETFESGDEPLDSTQAALNASLNQQVSSMAGGAAGPEAEAFVQHLTYALQYLLEGPDDLLAALTGGDTGEITGAGESLATNLSLFVEELLCAINSAAALDCETFISGAGVTPGFGDVEPFLAVLQGDLSGGADLSVILVHLAAFSDALAVSLDNIENEGGDLPGAPYSNSLFDMLEQASIDLGDILEIVAFEDDGAATNVALLDLLRNLLENLFIELPQLRDENPELAAQVENELQTAIDGINTGTNILIPFLIDDALNPSSDIIGAILDGLLHGLGIQG